MTEAAAMHYRGQAPSDVIIGEPKLKPKDHSSWELRVTDSKLQIPVTPRKQEGNLGKGQNAWRQNMRIITVIALAALASGVVFAAATVTQAQLNNYGEVTYVYDGSKWVRSSGPTYEQRITALEATVAELNAEIEKLAERMDGMGISPIEAHMPSDPPPNAPVIPSSNTPFYVRVDETSYTLGDSIGVTGQLPDACPPTVYDLDDAPMEQDLAFIHLEFASLGDSVSMAQLTCDANFRFSFVDKMPVNADGSFSGSWQVENDFPRGTYHVKITPPFDRFFDYKAFYSEPFTIE